MRVARVSHLECTLFKDGRNLSTVRTSCDRKSNLLIFCAILQPTARLVAFNAEAKRHISEQRKVILGLNAQVEFSEDRAMELSKFAEIAKGALRQVVSNVVIDSPKVGNSTKVQANVQLPQVQGLAVLRANLQQLRRFVDRNRKEQQMVFAHIHEILRTLKRGARRKPRKIVNFTLSGAVLRRPEDGPPFEVHAFVQEDKSVPESEFLHLGRLGTGAKVAKAQDH